MTLATRAAVVAAGVALCVPGAIALWRASSLKGDLHVKWRTRVDLARAGLSDLAATELVRIQTEIARTVAQGAVFDPTKLVEDPSTVRPSMEEFIRLLKTRDRLERRLKALCSLGPILLVTTTIYLIAVVVGTLEFARLIHLRYLGTVSVWVGGVAVLGFVVVVAVYAHLNDRLSVAEIESAGADGTQ